MSIVKVVWLSIKFGGKSDTVNTNKQTKTNKTCLLPERQAFGSYHKTISGIKF